MAVIPSVLLGRWCLLDLLDAARPKVPPPTRPEVDTSTPDPVTPFELLERRCFARNLPPVDYRDLETWPRKHTYDWREYGWPGDKSRAHPYGVRPWNRVTAICLHSFGVSGMGPERFLGVPTHFGIADEGTPVLCHDMVRLVAHGNGANRFSVGVEISGDSGFDSPEQIETGRTLIAYIVEERERNLDPSKPHPGPMSIMGHFMARRSKPVCPGERIMRELGAWAVDEFGLRRGPVLKGGMAPPESWWDRRVA